MYLLMLVKTQASAITSEYRDKIRLYLKNTTNIRDKLDLTRYF